MLLEFSCANHRSIKDKAVFSLLAGKDMTHMENIIESDGFRVLRSAVVYGANGSGKSSFISAISFARLLVVNSITHQPGQGIRQDKHKLSRLDDPTSYSLQFITGGLRFAYGFTLQNALVSEEYLYYFPNGRQAMIFERDSESFNIGSKFKKTSFATCKEVLKPNRLLLSCAANFCSVPEVDSAYRFFSEDLVIYDNQNNWMNYTLHEISENEQMKKALISFLVNLGIDVKNVRVSIEKSKLDFSQLPPFLSDEFKSMLVQNGETIDARMVYDQFETDLLNEESTGVKKLFSMICPLIDIMRNGKVLLCDELEANLHESLVYELVKAFSSAEINESAQLIFTTHETGLLSLDLFRRDQIWFTEMIGANRSTDLYSLAEINNVRKEENYGKGYISGKYGAIPMLNLDFASIVAQM